MERQNRGSRIGSYVLAGALLAGLAGGATACYSYFVPDAVETTIKRCEVKSGKYLVFTNDGVFQNTDAWYRLKWNSSDVQNGLIDLEGKKARITKYGWRVTPFSKYENIVGVEEIPDSLPSPSTP